MTESNDDQAITRCDKHVIAIDPQRLAWGTWDDTTHRHLGEGDVSASYSTDLIAQGRVRKPFILRGEFWVATNRGLKTATVFRLVSAEQFEGEATSYEQKVHPDSGRTARNDPLGFYHGMAVKRGGKRYVLSGPPLTLVRGEQAAEQTQGLLFE